MKIKHLLIAAIFSLLAIFCVLVWSIQRDDHFNLAKREILMREIGHEILLQSGDRTSRVLPVTKLEGEKYRLQFERQFNFTPDSLVQIIKKNLASNQETHDYIVNVLNCSDESVVYGYSISKAGANNIVPCLGRTQIPDCYRITIEFGRLPFTVKKYAATASLLAMVALFPLTVIRYRRKKKPIAEKTSNPEKHQISMGNILFDTGKKQLLTPSGNLSLTVKETKILLIFAQNPNEVIDRTRLQKEIWEDDGIIVGRSLDVFISKLRKKLESDPSIQLANIHGKGYKLQIDSLSV